MATVSRDRQAQLWKVTRGRPFHRLSVPNLGRVTFSPTGEMMAGVTDDSLQDAVYVWKAGGQPETLRMKGLTYNVSDITFNPDGSLLASGSWDTTIGLWQVATGNELGRLRAHKGYVQSVTFSPDGRLLASGSWDRTVRLWRIGEETDVWEKISDEWQRHLSPQWVEAGRCQICGEEIYFWNRWWVTDFAGDIGDIIDFQGLDMTKVTDKLFKMFHTKVATIRHRRL